MPHLLLVTYFFPPLGGVGVQRPLRFARYLPDLGWDVTVLAPSNPAYPVRDDPSPSPRDQDYRVIRSAILELPGRPYRVRQWLATRSVPDERAGWIPMGLRTARRLARQADIVLSTSPPLSAHALAGKAAAAAGRPWVADYRDPYSDNLYAAGERVSRKRAYEATLLRGASALTAAWPALTASLAAKTRARVELLPNAFDPEEFEMRPQPLPRGASLRLTHVGSLYGKRTVGPLVQGLLAARAMDAEAIRNLSFRFVGRVAETDRRLVEAQGLQDQVEFVGFLSRDKALAEMCRSDVLLLLFPPDEGAAEFVPGKIYEYFAARRPMFAVVGDGASRDLLTRSGGAIMVHPDRPDEIGEALIGLARRGTDGIGLPDRGFVERYSAPVVVRQLSDLLYSVLEERGT